MLLAVTEFALSSARKFVWVLLGPGLVSPGPKQIQPAAGFLRWFVQQQVNKMCPSIPKPMHISYPCLLLNIEVLETHRETLLLQKRSTFPRAAPGYN